MREHHSDIVKVLAWACLIGYGACLLFWMFRGFGRTMHTEYRYNLIPLHTILGYMANANSHNMKTTVINLAGNIGVFVPFGVLIPILFDGLKRFGRFIGWFTASVIVLELLQTFLRVGTGDVDDVILNGIGASCGYMLYRRFAPEHRNGGGVR